MSEAFRGCEGNFFSHLFNIIGRSEIIIAGTERPSKSSPADTKITLFGKRLLGPIKKFDTPEKNSPRKTRVIRFMHLDRYGTTNDIMQ